MVPLLSWASVAIALVVGVCPWTAVSEFGLDVVELVAVVVEGVLGCAVDDAVHFILRLGSNCADCDLFDILGFDDAVGFFLGACGQTSLPPYILLHLLRLLLLYVEVTAAPHLLNDSADKEEYVVGKESYLTFS